MTAPITSSVFPEWRWKQLQKQVKNVCSIGLEGTFSQVIELANSYLNCQTTFSLLADVVRNKVNSLANLVSGCLEYLPSQSWETVQLLKDGIEVLEAFIDETPSDCLTEEFLEALDFLVDAIDLKEVENLQRLVMVNRRRAQLHNLLEEEIPRWELELGNYETVELLIEKPKQLKNLIDALNETLVAQFSQLENAVYDNNQWTEAVALCDELAHQGLEDWDEGLEVLGLYVQTQQFHHRKEGLDLLLEGNRKFILVERISEHMKTL